MTFLPSFISADQLILVWIVHTSTTVNNSAWGLVIRDAWRNCVWGTKFGLLLSKDPSAGDFQRYTTPILFNIIMHVTYHWRYTNMSLHNCSQCHRVMVWLDNIAKARAHEPYFKLYLLFHQIKQQIMWILLTIWVEQITSELHFRRTERVIWGKGEFSWKDSSFKTCTFWTPVMANKYKLLKQYVSLFLISLKL